MTVSTSTLTSAYGRADVHKFDFIDSASSIDVLAADSDIVYSFDNITFSCPRHIVTVCSLSGKATIAVGVLLQRNI